MKAARLRTATLPDIIVRCGKLADDATSLDDPKVLVEVVSPASEGRDRVEKWEACRQLATLQHHVLVERDRAAIDVFGCAGDVWAVRRTIEGLSSEFGRPAVDVYAPLNEIYEDVLST